MTSAAIPLKAPPDWMRDDYDLSPIPVIDDRWSEPGYAHKVRIKGRAAALFVRIWSCGLRVERLGWENNRKARQFGKPVLYITWHGSQLVPLALFRDRGIINLISLSRDGDIQNVCMKSLGYRTIRGSSSRGGARALLHMVKEMPKYGAAGFTIDGPRGPFHKAKPGAAILAQKTGAAVLPVGVAHSLCHRLKSWDQFEIPFPFSKSVLVTGEPFFIPAEMNLESAANLMEEKISNCDQLARQRIIA